MKAPLPPDENERPKALQHHEFPDSKEELIRKTVFLEAQVNSSVDGILVVDPQNKKILQNERFNDLLKIPRSIAEDKDDKAQLRWVTDMVKNPAPFAEKVVYLYSHPDETSRDEIELKDGRILDRYSSPVTGKDGKYYGRIWTFRDITESKRTAAALLESSRFLQFTLDALSAHIAILDEHGTIIAVNAAWNRFAGEGNATANNGAGDNYLKVCDSVSGDFADEASAVGAGIRAVMAGQREEFHLEYPCHSPREKRWFIIRVTRFGGDGPVRVVVAHENITDRKQAELEKAQTSELLEALLANTDDDIYFKDLQSRFVRFSRALLNDLHLSRPDELIGRTDFDLFTEEHARPAFEAEQEIIRTGQPILNLEEKETYLDGRVAWVLTSKMAWRDPAGNIIGTMGISRDITERKQAERELAQTSALLGAMLANTIDHIYFKDLQSRFVRFSRSVLKHFKLAHPDELTGRTDFDFYIEEHARPLFEAEQEIIRTGQPILNQEEKIDQIDGRGGWVSTSKMAWRDPAGNIIGTMGISRDITERKRAEESLVLFRTLIDQSSDAIVVVDAETRRYLDVNEGACASLGYNREELLSMSVFDIDTDISPSLLKKIEKALQTAGFITFESGHRRKDGTTFQVEVNLKRVQLDKGYVVSTVRDITERKKLETQLVQSQKMETVGKLAGGIAHEFNSILTAIIGQSELLLNDLPAASPLAKNATEIRKAANRAALLTQQLLAYGRKQFLQPEILDLNHVVAGLKGMFHNLLGGDVDLQIVPAADLHAVKADAGQIEQVIMNMIVNARDAMPNGGRLLLETANITFDLESVGRYPELNPGDYVMLAITDTGTGMSDAVKARVFEPFFTTKDVGEGTGLGLSTCYGIVKQSGGHISVYSEPARGTTFKIYLPRIESEKTVPVERLGSPDLPGGTETILLVEDDPALRDMAATLLRRLGYTIFAAADGVEALAVQHKRGTGHVDLLFTDVVMPNMSGKELADRVRALYPRTKILFTSAYTENAIVHQGVLEKGVALLQKQFTPSALAHKVREVLDQSKVP
jgi:PAS domain S-box-containing protein